MSEARAGADMHAYYAARAAEYDRVYDKPERQDDLGAIRRWLPPRFAGARVLEVACGTGYWTQFIAPVAATVVGVDASPETLQVARSRVGANVELLVGDAYALPADRGRFDAAFAGFWFSHVPRRRRREFLAGLGRVLMPGATVVLLDNLYVEGSSSPIVETDGAGDTYQARGLADGSTYRVLKNFPSEAELRALVVGLGEQATLESFEYYWAFSYRTATPAEPAPRDRCPLCGGLNACVMAAGRSAGTPCWCEAASFSPALLARVPEAARGLSCICAGCAAAPTGRAGLRPPATPPGPP